MTDKKPWALDNCDQFKSFRKALEENGLTLRMLSSGKIETDQTRGDNIISYAVHSDQDGMIVTTIVIRAFGPNGFAMYLEAGGLLIADSVAMLVDLERNQRQALNAA